VYRGIWHGLTTVVRNEGFFALYTGLGPTLAGIIPYAGIQLSVYDKTKDALSARRTNKQATQVDYFVSGAFAGAVAQTVSFPIELVRRRMQTRGFGASAGQTKYAGVADCVRDVVRTGGVRALYFGLVPNLLKIVPAAGISFVTFEALRGRGKGEPKVQV